MPILVALTGMSGSGKTTAIRHFEDQGFGTRVYFGQAVLDRIAARNLRPGPESERQVRLELRATEGPAALATRALPLVRDLIRLGTNVFVDAIFDFEEYLCLQSHCKDCDPILLAIEASFETRSNRLSKRPERSLTATDLRKRDEIETANLKINRVLAQANHRIENEGTLEALRLELNRFWSTIRLGS